MNQNTQPCGSATVTTNHRESERQSTTNQIKYNTHTIVSFGYNQYVIPTEYMHPLLNIIQFFEKMDDIYGSTPVVRNIDWKDSDKITFTVLPDDAYIIAKSNALLDDSDKS